MKRFAVGILWLSPLLILLGLFTVWPALRTVDMSFYTRYNYFRDLVFERGLDNYAYLWNDPEFWRSLDNTFFYTAWTLPLSVGIGLALALALNAIGPFKRLFQTIYFLPFVTSTVAIALVWNWIFHLDHGLLSAMLQGVGLDPIPWLRDPQWARVSLVILGVWKSAGYNVLIFLTGLQTIDAQYNRSAAVDGAGFWRRTFFITLPLLSPTLLFVCVISAINCFKVFDLPFILFRSTPGPSNCGMTLVYYIYEKFYNQHHYGIASAAVLLLFGFITLFNLIQFRLARRTIHYGRGK